MPFSRNKDVDPRIWGEKFSAENILFVTALGMLRD